MSGLSLGELKKRPGRIDTFVNKFVTSSPFVFDDGKSRVLTSIIIDNNEYNLSNLSKVKSKQEEQTKQIKKQLENLTKAKISVRAENKVYAVSKLTKTNEFGGTGGTSKDETNTKISGGTITEVLSETGFCFYYALQVTNQLDSFKKESFQTVGTVSDYKKLISKYRLSEIMSDSVNDTQLNQYIKTMYAFLGTGFDEILRAQVKKFDASFSGIGKSCYVARSGAIPDDYSPYTTYREVAGSMQKKFNFDSKIGEDKWNPADLWIYNNEGIRRLKELNKAAKKLTSSDPDSYNVAILNMVNDEIYKMYKKGVCYPVSLKKSGLNPHIDEINVAGAIEKIVKFKKVELSQGNIDVKFYFTLQMFQKNKMIYNRELKLKMKAGSSGGFRLEIEGGADARFGSIGTGIYQFIIKGTDSSGISKLQKIRKEFADESKKLNEIIPKPGDKLWFGGNEYKNTVSKDKSLADDLLPYLQRMFSEINGGQEFDLNKVKTGTNAEKIYNKTAASELAISIEGIVNKYAKEIVIENLVDAASSSRIGAGIRPEQIESRKKQLGGNIDKDLQSLPVSVAQTVFTSCFHLKIS